MKERRQVSDRTEVDKTRAEKSLTDRIKVAVLRGELAAWRDRKAKLSGSQKNTWYSKERSLTASRVSRNDSTKSPCHMMVW